MISRKSSAEVMEACRIEEVVGDFVRLRRSGSALTGLCPFHNEKSPSFNVTPSKNMFKCFGCGKGGDSVTFIMEHENLSFTEAIRYLATKYRIDLVETVASAEQFEERQLIDSLYIINEFARAYFQGQLYDTDEGKSIALSYFRHRGLTEDTVRGFGLGYASSSWDGFVSHARLAGHDVEMLKKLGLTKDGTRDFFRDRVMFPIQSMSGKVIGFGGRVMTKDAPVAKYINSPESDIYTKSKTLYGIFQGRTAIRKLDECILTEGYMDVISLHQAGIQNAVASSGTSLTTDQIRMIKRLTPNIKILYDGDPAGIKAAMRGLDMVLAEDMNVRIALLPIGEDPDSYVQKVGAEGFRSYLTEHSTDFILFKTKVLSKDAGDDPIKRSHMIREVVSSIALIPDTIKRAVYIRDCSTILKIEEAALISEINKILLKTLEEKRKDRDRKQERENDAENQPPPDERDYDNNAALPAARVSSSGHEIQERDIARILVLFGGEKMEPDKPFTLAAAVLSSIQDVMEDFDNPLYGKIAKETLYFLQNEVPLSPQVFLKHADNAIVDFTMEVSFSKFLYSENWEAMHEIFLRNQPKPDLNFKNDALQAVRRFKLRKLDRLSSQNQAAIAASEKDGNMDTLLNLLKVQQKINAARVEIAKLLGTVVTKG